MTTDDSPPAGTMANRARTRKQRRAGGRAIRSGFLALAVGDGALGLAGAPIAYMLWPMPAPLSPFRASSIVPRCTLLVSRKNMPYGGPPVILAFGISMSVRPRA